MKFIVTGPQIGSMVSAAKKRFTPYHVIGHLAKHELDHERQDTEKKGDTAFGLIVQAVTVEFPTIIDNQIKWIKKQLEHVVGAFYQFGERSPEVRKAIAEGPSDPSDKDRQIASDAETEIIRNSYLEWIYGESEDSNEETTEDESSTTKPDSKPEENQLDLRSIFEEKIIGDNNLSENEKDNLFHTFQELLHEHHLKKIEKDEPLPNPNDLFWLMIINHLASQAHEKQEQQPQTPPLPQKSTIFHHPK